MKDDGHIHNCILPDGVHRAMNGVFGAVVCATAGAVGWEKFGDTPALGTLFPWLLRLAVPFGIVMLFVNPKKVSIVEGHTSPDIAFDELGQDDENQQAEQSNTSELISGGRADGGSPKLLIRSVGRTRDIAGRAGPAGGPRGRTEGRSVQ